VVSISEIARRSFPAKATTLDLCGHVSAPLIKQRQPLNPHVPLWWFLAKKITTSCLSPVGKSAAQQICVSSGRKCFDKRFAGDPARFAWKGRSCSDKKTDLGKSAQMVALARSCM
jgi:hypothetical protein